MASTTKLSHFNSMLDFSIKRPSHSTSLTPPDMKLSLATPGYLFTTQFFPSINVNLTIGLDSAKPIAYTIIKPCLTTSIESPKTTEVPSCYEEFREVFSKIKATQLSPHRLWDCAIDLLPNAMPPKSKVYPLSRNETQAMEEYIDEAMNSGFIRPSTSGFFFVEM